VRQCRMGVHQTTAGAGWNSNCSAGSADLGVLGTTTAFATAPQLQLLHVTGRQPMLCVPSASHATDRLVCQRLPIATRAATVSKLCKHVRLHCAKLHHH
jgi:hypothetical protein